MTDHLPNQSQTAPLVGQPEFSGAILGLQGDVLHGWAIDNAQPEHRPIVEVLIDGASVALVRAEQYEPNAPVGDLFHGFAVQLRQRWLDGARLITAQIANQPFILQGQIPLPATPSDDSAAVASQVWHTGGLRIGGWCWDPKAPNRHVEVTVRNGDQIVGRALCNQHNQALAYRASSDHGFAIDLPWSLADGKVHELEIFNDHGRPLAGSPIRLCCWPEGVEGLISRLDPSQDATTLALLNEVAKEQSARLPKSAGWNSYSKWFETFQHLDAIDTPSLIGKPGVLLIGEGDAGLEQRTLSSLGSCHEYPHALAHASAADLGPALDKLIASGCDRILPIQAGDRLAKFALGHLSALLADGSAWAYSDCDQDGPENERTSPWLKPVWDIDLFIGADIFTAGAIFSVSVIQEALALLCKSSNEDEISWHRLMAAVALATELNAWNVTHLPRVLYHRSYLAAPSPERAQRCSEREAAIAWLCEHLAEGAQTSVVMEYPSLVRAHWPLPDQLPRVTLIVPTRDQFKLLSTCIEGLLKATDYGNLEIIVVDNQSTDPDTLTYLSTLEARDVTVLRHPFAFNYSAINNRAVKYATGEIVGLINNDIEIIESSWLKEMVSQILRPNVGAVGAKLLWPNGMVQHGGVTVGINGLAAHVGNNLAHEDAGYMATNHLVRRQSALTAACLLVKKTDYIAVGGLDEDLYPVAFNDVDLCLKIHASGKRNIWTPFAKLIHAESASRGKDLTNERRARAEREQQNFYRSWLNFEDVCYHPGLSHDYLTGPYQGLAIPFTNLRPRSIRKVNNLI
ncbi:glycosyltransferase family 2 protein [Pseudomonas fulva]|uniref:glycosyltransferase family 2 protein n=1 Tax=Pseudomonas fulva TaxID=47880 RepID=UPI000F7830A1|nr:glycosyltransferase [Pseudomonas fulva]MBA1207527.1 glycosyltransferase [Pseudomonas fulva]MBA1216940.1 glycosyltransferase [Pseudomonas fulva]MDH0571607.1 glycosyltransferase [Pseudomonas fulva]RRW63672.1 glycosyltransferase [Pseudomonas fulva]